MLSPALPQFPLANLITWLTPLPWVLLGAATVAAGLVACYWLLRVAFPKTAAIARTTAKEAVSQPLFVVVLVTGVVVLLLFPFIPYNTFGDDLKMHKDGGLTVIMLLSIVLAVWTASVSISDEIEGRTALTLLSKPVGRRQFILGKFLGIVASVAMLFIVFGSLFLATVSYKVVYDAREVAQPDPTWTQCRDEMVQIAPGIALAFMETVVLAAVSVAISTRLPMMPNLIICASVYVLGHLTPLLASSAVGQFPIVPFIADLIGTVLPMLDHFNIYAAISTGREVPLSYVGVAGLYCLLYSSLAMFLALLLFEDRDLA
ncbi:MAG: ABC transporter permease subunit [Patescibacteria group bacterium]|nr:ABC transporter permease subunit [Patescibacteria group bacterium]